MTQSQQTQTGGSTEAVMFNLDWLAPSTVDVGLQPPPKPAVEPDTTQSAHAELERAWQISAFAEAFQRATGFASQLVLVANDAKIPPPYKHATNPFCHLLGKLAGNCRCLPCAQLHQHPTAAAAKAAPLGRVPCPMGLSEVAVPVNVHGRTVAILYGGQVFRGPPRHGQFDQLVERLVPCGFSAEDLGRLRESYGRTPVLTEQQYRAAVTLLGIFAHQLADSANGWIVYGHAHEPAAVRQAKFYVRLHLEEPLTTESVARHVGVSVDRFGRQFKMSTGMTLKEYLNRARVERVKQLLTNPGARISESALAAGFRELGHFNHIFKRYTGQTPREFRSKAIPNSDK